MAMAGVRILSQIPAAVASVGGAAEGAGRGGRGGSGRQLRSSLGGRSSSMLSSRSFFMRTALLGFMAPGGMFSTPQPALARSGISDIPEPWIGTGTELLPGWWPSVAFTAVIAIVAATQWPLEFSIATRPLFKPISFRIRRFIAGGSESPSQVLKGVTWPQNFPFTAEHFQRYDESSDLTFYQNPRFVTHIDDPAIKALSQYYASAFPPANTPGTAVLDLCSSWVSHYPKNYSQEKVVGMGMNENELRRNPVLTDYIVQDLNVDPKLPFEDNSFDVITNAVSVDYLTKPLQVFKEMNRVLKPGGFAAMSFSNRCFFTKAVSIWTSTDDADHVWIVGSYFHYAGGFEPPQALDISPYPGRSDPMYVVFAKKATA